MVMASSRYFHTNLSLPNMINTISFPKLKEIAFDDFSEISSHMLNSIVVREYSFDNIVSIHALHEISIIRSSGALRINDFNFFSMMNVTTLHLECCKLEGNFSSFTELFKHRKFCLRLSYISFVMLEDSEKLELAELANALPESKLVELELVEVCTFSKLYESRLLGEIETQSLSLLANNIRLSQLAKLNLSGNKIGNKVGNEIFQN